MTPTDYWLSLAVYDDFRGIPVRKVIAEGYIELRGMDQEQQAIFIRLGSLFFQGRSWCKFAGHDIGRPLEHLTEAELREFESFRPVRPTFGAAVVRMLNDDQTLNPFTREATIERMASMGFIDGDGI